ncbi:MAG: hypothetical protein RJQ09_21390 [Cyclobacteriaceae bacterium]
MKEQRQKTKEKYLLWNGQYVGNALLFWANDYKGFTSNIDKAHLYTKKEVDHLLKILNLKSINDRMDKAISLTEIEKAATRVVDEQSLDMRATPIKAKIANHPSPNRPTA